MVTYSVVHQNFEEKRISYADTFTWEGQPFDIRPNQSDTAFTRRKRSVVHPDDAHLSVRKEETDMGTLIIADRISVINRYLKGPARRPFIHPRSLYVILISDAMESTCGKESQNVMVKLWKHYGIADAILITPCSESPKVFFWHTLIVTLVLLILIYRWLEHIFHSNEQTNSICLIGVNTSA